MVRLGLNLKRFYLRALLYPHRLVPTALKRHRNLPAFGDGTSYRLLLTRVHQLAAAMRNAGDTAKGDRVLIDLVNCREFMELRLACILAGLVAVPVPPGTDPERLVWLADFTGAKLYFGYRGGDLPGLRCIRLDPTAGDRREYEQWLESPPVHMKSEPIEARDLLTINFTSGTTGEPKGVMSTVAGWGWSLYYALLENRLPIVPGEVFLHCIPLATAGSTLILPALLSGAKSVFLPRWDPREAARLIETERVSRLFLTPTMLAQLTDVVRHGNMDTSSLKNIIYGTEGIPAARIRKALDTFGPILQQGYGMAEALPPVCLFHARDHELAHRNPQYRHLLTSAGKPTRAVDLKVCDATGRSLPPGTPGSIRLRGKTVSPGYWRRPDLTQASRKDGFYISGDVGYLDEGGYLHVMGREGSTPSPAARAAWEEAESRDDVVLAWTVETSDAIELHIVSSSARMGTDHPHAQGTEIASADARPVRTVIHQEVPTTSSYKLGTSSGDPSRKI